MSAPAFLVADPAKLQVDQLPEIEKRALRAFFESNYATLSKVTENGLRVGRVGERRVLWKPDSKGKPVVLSVIDASYAPKT